MAKSETHYVYMLLCKGDRVYTGYATDAEARYRKHCQGVAASFTRAFPPVALLCVIAVASRSHGLRLEAAIKRMPRRRKDLFVHATNRVGNVAVQLLLGPQYL